MDKTDEIAIGYFKENSSDADETQKDQFKARQVEKRELSAQIEHDIRMVESEIFRRLTKEDMAKLEIFEIVNFSEALKELASALATLEGYCNYSPYMGYCGGV